MKPIKVLTVAGVMTPFPHSIDIEASLKEAMATMKEYGVRHLPVTENELLVSVLSLRDIQVIMSPFQHDREEVKELMVRDVCAVDAYVVDIHASAAKVVTMMIDRAIGSAVVTKEGRLAGILTHTDIARKFLELIAPKSEEPDDWCA